MTRDWLQTDVIDAIDCVYPVEYGLAIMNF